MDDFYSKFTQSKYFDYFYLLILLAVFYSAILRWGFRKVMTSVFYFFLVFLLLFLFQKISPFSSPNEK